MFFYAAVTLFVVMSLLFLFVVYVYFDRKTFCEKSASCWM